MGWDISGIPCERAVRYILRERKELEDYVDEAYNTGKYMQAYDVIMNPIKDLCFGLNEIVLNLVPFS